MHLTRKNPTRLAVIFGGVSTEHEVSLQSAKNIISAAVDAGFCAVPIYVTRAGAWHLIEDVSTLDHITIASRLSDHSLGHQVALVPGEKKSCFIDRSTGASIEAVDVVFPIIHGTGGEDGSLQGLLDLVGLPYVGPGVLSSAVCFDKEVVKRLLNDAGIPSADYIAIRKGDEIDVGAIVSSLGLPLFVKPANAGSSVGVSKVSKQDELASAIREALRFDHKVLIEEAVVGREIECAIIGNAHASCSVPGEITAPGGFYSYAEKYLGESKTQLRAPALLSAQEEQLCQSTALKTYQVLECCGLSRVDLFLCTDRGSDGPRVLVNEVNTLPGFTNISMYPKLWSLSGMSNKDLLQRLVELAIERFEDRAALETAP